MKAKDNGIDNGISGIRTLCAKEEWGKAERLVSTSEWERKGNGSERSAHAQSLMFAPSTIGKLLRRKQRAVRRMAARAASTRKESEQKEAETRPTAPPYIFLSPRQVLK
jgi:hypothetical protein